MKAQAPLELMFYPCLGWNPSEEEIEDMIEESDKDGSGSMDFLVRITVIEILDEVDFTTSRVL